MSYLTTMRKNSRSIALVSEDISFTFAADTFSEIVTFPNPTMNGIRRVISSPGGSSDIVAVYDLQ